MWTLRRNYGMTTGLRKTVEPVHGVPGGFLRTGKGRGYLSHARNSWLPSVPVIGEGSHPIQERFSSSVTKVRMESTALRCKAGSRTMPPGPISSGWSSNWGLMSTRASPPFLSRGKAAGRIFFREVPLPRILFSFKSHLFPPPGGTGNTTSRSPGAFRCMSGRKKGHIIAMWPSCIRWRHQGDLNPS